MVYINSNKYLAENNSFKDKQWPENKVPRCLCEMLMSTVSRHRAKHIFVKVRKYTLYEASTRCFKIR